MAQDPTNCIQYALLKERKEDRETNAAMTKAKQKANDWQRLLPQLQSKTLRLLRDVILCTRNLIVFT